MIGQINGHAVSSAKGIVDGTERAVSNEERLNMLLEQARQVQTDVRPGNWTPTKLACVEIDALRAELAAVKLDLEFHQRVRASQAAMIGRIRGEWFEQLAEIAWLRRPLWMKIVGWFAR